MTRHYFSWLGPRLHYVDVTYSLVFNVKAISFEKKTSRKTLNISMVGCNHLNTTSERTVILM